jgi:hypothetical protein
VVEEVESGDWGIGGNALTPARCTPSREEKLPDAASGRWPLQPLDDPTVVRRLVLSGRTQGWHPVLETSWPVAFGHVAKSSRGVDYRLELLRACP